MRSPALVLLSLGLLVASAAGVAVFVAVAKIRDARRLRRLRRSMEAWKQLTRVSGRRPILVRPDRGETWLKCPDCGAPIPTETASNSHLAPCGAVCRYALSTDPLTKNLTLPVHAAPVVRRTFAAGRIERLEVEAGRCPFGCFDREPSDP